MVMRVILKSPHLVFVNPAWYTHTISIRDCGKRDHPFIRIYKVPEIILSQAFLFLPHLRKDAQI